MTSQSSEMLPISTLQAPSSSSSSSSQHERFNNFDNFDNFRLADSKVNMRIRLTIQRNRLDPVEILWTIPEDSYKSPGHTISRWLAEVDEAFPLETDEWGLEDYVVHIQGFECLHFKTTGDVFRNGDHVTIRPLETADIRSRQMSGRHQISTSGISLFDGVPFGRPPTRARSLVRPKVYIPPRKRRRLTNEDDDYGNEDVNGSISLTDIDGISEQLLLVNSGEATIEQPKIQNTHKQRPRKLNKSVRFDGVFSENMTDRRIDQQFEEANMNRRAKLTSQTKIVRFADEYMVDMSDEDDDEDFDPCAVDEEDSTDDEEFSDSEASEVSNANTTSGSDSDSDFDGDIEPTTKAVQEPRMKEINFQKGGSMNETPNHSDGYGISNEDNRLAREKRSMVSHAPPGHGQRRTQIRNRRRHLSKKLRKLQSTGILPPNSTVRDLKDWLAKQESLADVVKTPLRNNVVISTSNGNKDSKEHNVLSSDSSSDSSDSESENKGTDHLSTHQLTNQERSAQGPTTTIKKSPNLPELLLATEKPINPTNHTDELEERRQKLLAAIDGNEKIASQPESPGPAEKASRRTPVDEPPIQEHPRKRQRRIVEVANRMIFANLGLRAPRTEAEAEAVKEKLMNKAKDKKSAAAPVTPISLTTAEVPPESDFWKNKIVLSAVECCDEGIVLSSPPYPFTQRWDPQQQDEYYQSGLNGFQGKHRKNSKNSYTDEYEVHDDFYDDQPGETITTLDYDEETEASGPMVGNTNSNVQPDNKSHFIDDITLVDDLPLLPTTVDTLKPLEKEDILPGAIIAYKLLEVSKATNWAPGISHYRTAKILQDDDLDESAIKIELAIRDREKAEYDEEGKRIFGKFEMVIDDDEQDDGIRILNVRELIEPKLVQVAMLAKLDDEQPEKT